MARLPSRLAMFAGFLLLSAGISWAQTETAESQWDEAHNAGDVATLMTLYAGTAVSMPYNRPALEGRAAIDADFRAFFSACTARHKTTIVSHTTAPTPQ